MSQPSSWSPTPDGLAKVLSIFTPPTQHSYQQREQLVNHPEYTYYLAYILMYLPQHANDVRQWNIPNGQDMSIIDFQCTAGIELKNRIMDFWPDRIDQPTQEYVKACVLSVLGDPTRFLRNQVGSIVTAICKKGGLANWPGILEHLCRMLDSDQLPAVEGAFNALAKICEDMPKQLDSDELHRPLNHLIPKFITFFLHSSMDVRRYAVATVNVFLLTMPLALRTNIDAYLRNLFVLAGQDKSPEIRKRVCQAFVLLVGKEYNLLHPHIEPVIQFMLTASNDEDEEVALEACEFWSAYCEIKQMDKQLLSKYVEHLIPILLKGMRYSSMELSQLGEDDDDQYRPDRAEDIKPHFHRSAAGGHHSMDANDENDELEEEDDEDVDEFPDDDDDEDGNETQNWTLRKCSAAALDTLASVYKSDLLPALLPQLQRSLNARGVNEKDDETKWTERESAVLALGAIAEGCYDKLREYLPGLIPHLIQNFFNDSKPLVRSITCWTLSRYCKWIISETLVTCRGDHTLYFQPLTWNLLIKIKDRNKKVQEAACSAFATLEEEARTMLVPYLKDILTTLMEAFHNYQAKNMLILYDTLGTLSDAVHEELNKPELIQILMPPLIKKWNSLSDDDRNIFPLFECLTAVAQALGTGFQQFAEPIFQRCAVIIRKNFEAQAEAEAKEAQHIDVEFPDKEFIVCALDLLSGLSEGLEQNIEPLVGKYSQTFLGLLYQCMKDLDPDVRQSAFALLGDLAKNCMGHIRPHLHLILPTCASNLNPVFDSVCNNASWAIGEIAMKSGPDALAPFVGDILCYLTPILLTSHERPLLENVSITIGRLACVCPAQVAPSLEKIAVKWMECLTPLKENYEKEHAFKGLSLVIQQNPIALVTADAIPQLASAIASWQEPSQELNEIFRQLLHSYRINLGAQWDMTVRTFDSKVRAIIAQRYQI